jgi:hypothetical protein
LETIHASNPQIHCFFGKQNLLFPMKITLAISICLVLLSCCTAQRTCAQSLPFSLKKQNYSAFLATSVQKASILPPKQKATLAKLLVSQTQASEKQQAAILYWHVGPPGYRWHQIMGKVSEQNKNQLNGGRMAILHLAIYDATVAVWQLKKNWLQKAPHQAHKGIKAWVKPWLPNSAVCERSAVAGAAREIIAYYFPNSRPYLDSLVKDFIAARQLSGLQFQSDIESGLAIGVEIAQHYINHAKADGTNALWEGTVPTGPNLWTGNPGKKDPMKAKWKPLTLLKQDQFRPGPPPDFSPDMAELRAFNAKNQSSDIAWKWKSEPVWDDLIERKTLEYQLDPLQAAYANAMFHVARYDGIIAAWDAKYTYWGIRPFQLDPSFKPILVVTPNFPGYPAGHTTVAGSIATVLGHLFPAEKVEFENLARECAESRFEGGVHFRTDNETGLQMGKKVGEWIIQRFERR